MSKNLVIVESPAKAKTIEKYLGKDFTVLSSVGHIRSIAKKTKDGKPPIEVGYAPSYKDAADLIRRWAAIRSHTENISYFRVEERYYV